MDASRQFCFDTFNGQGPRWARGPLETILRHGGYRRDPKKIRFRASKIINFFFPSSLKKSKFSNPT